MFTLNSKLTICHLYHTLFQVQLPQIHEVPSHNDMNLTDKQCRFPTCNGKEFSSVGTRRRHEIERHSFHIRDNRTYSSVAITRPGSTPPSTSSASPLPPNNASSTQLRRNLFRTPPNSRTSSR